jgi:hypothetical protein
VAAPTETRTIHTRTIAATTSHSSRAAVVTSRPRPRTSLVILSDAHFDTYRVVARAATSKGDAPFDSALVRR